MSATAERFRHEALLYADHEEFLAGCVPFIRGGLAAGEPVLVVESEGRTKLLRDALGADAERVGWADMNAVGANPARIIPAWKEFVERHGSGGRRLRGIGEPIWSERSSDELVECQRHESLLNIAFGEGQAWWLLCPYDTSNLDASVIEEARRSHEYVIDMRGPSGASASFRDNQASGPAFDAAMPDPEDLRLLMRFDRESLLSLRGHVARQAIAAGLRAESATEFVTAVNEVATNSVLHGGGGGTLRVWRPLGSVVCEVLDTGHYPSQLADRSRPGEDAGDPRGLWVANQLCDLVQVRSLAGGTAVRLHMKVAR
ncbi:MAG TPA: anti-sigma factor RsbA family regulatory protein [Candidatus Dormibacteraeota bacterium]|nr:anti-sigma factor RsbA family regulatory protein [Candidatus Dormibacteraeota bacterium]